MRANPSTGIVCLPFLESSECESLLQRLEGAEWRDGRVATPAQAAAVERKVRSCAIAELSDAALTARIERAIVDLNRGFFDFALDGFSAKDPITAMRYLAEDHFDWHIDNAAEPYETRKLSFTVQLSDGEAYRGGDLEFAVYAQHPEVTAQVRRRGSITIFPSFHLHRVAPLEAGARVALVGWMHGPRFR